MIGQGWYSLKGTWSSNELQWLDKDDTPLKVLDLQMSYNDWSRMILPQGYLIFKWVTMIGQEWYSLTGTWSSNELQWLDKDDTPLRVLDLQMSYNDWTRMILPYGYLIFKWVTMIGQGWYSLTGTWSSNELQWLDKDDTPLRVLDLQMSYNNWTRMILPYRYLIFKWVTMIWQRW